MEEGLESSLVVLLRFCLVGLLPQVCHFLSVGTEVAHFKMDLLYYY